MIARSPSATKATGTALRPGRAHDWRAGAPTGWMTALPSKKLAEKTMFLRRRQVSHCALSQIKPAT